MTELLELRVHGPSSLPTLIYLPGLHGDWTLVGSFRRALRGRVRFVETTYPRTLTWSLEDYAAAIESALASQGITGGWLLGESFGSQLIWPIAARRRFEVVGIILAGGFVRHPARWAARIAERLGGKVPIRLITRMLFGYVKVARFRYRHSPEVLSSVKEFIARRTTLDRDAAVHRLRLVAENDPCPSARAVNTPIYALTGALDPIVPWFWVRRWLRKHCHNLRDYKIIWPADHTVLATAPDPAAKQVIKWMAADTSPAPTN
jgi:pimeloyl-ACP methyl ester carboxylesterase